MKQNAHQAMSCSCKMSTREKILRILITLITPVVSVSIIWAIYYFGCWETDRIAWNDGICPEYNESWRPNPLGDSLFRYGYICHERCIWIAGHHSSK